MLRYATIIAPLLMRKGTPNPVRVLTGYMGALFMTLFAGVFFLAALFTWIATSFGLDVAFLTIALILTLGAIALTIMARVSKTIELKKVEDRHLRIKTMLASKEDPLSDHIPEDVLMHPFTQKVLAQVEDKPWIASATALGLGMMLSHQFLDSVE